MKSTTVLLLLFLALGLGCISAEDEKAPDNFVIASVISDREFPQIAVRLSTGEVRMLVLDGLGPPTSESARKTLTRMLSGNWFNASSFDGGKTTLLTTHNITTRVSIGTENSTMPWGGIFANLAFIEMGLAQTGLANPHWKTPEGEQFAEKRQAVVKAIQPLDLRAKLQKSEAGSQDRSELLNTLQNMHVRGSYAIPVLKSIIENDLQLREQALGTLARIGIMQPELIPYILQFAGKHTDSVMDALYVFGSEAQSTHELFVLEAIENAKKWTDILKVARFVHGTGGLSPELRAKVLRLKNAQVRNAALFLDDYQSFEEDWIKIRNSLTDKKMDVLKGFQ